MKRYSRIAGLAAGLTLALAGGTAALAASHREAPLISNDPAADITDVYAFRSWEDPSRVVFIMNVIPGQEPSSGPNYFNFDDTVSYEIHLDTNRDGDADDIVYQVRFRSEIRAPFNDLPVSYAGVDPVPGLPPAITALDGPNSVGLGLRQSYSVTEFRGNRRRDLGQGRMFAVPSNVGPRTMPDYESLAAQGTYPLRNGGRVFAGQRDETFYIDLGATFDTLNFRAPPILTDTQDRDDTSNPFGNDMFSGFNVNTIAIEVPIADITTTPSSTIGMYASTSRQRVRTLVTGGSASVGSFVQVARMANPLVNELIIGTGQKDRWNSTDPEQEGQFVDFYLNPRLVAVINLAFGTSFPTTGRNDLVAALLQYASTSSSQSQGDVQAEATRPPRVCTGSQRCADLLRLNLAVAPTPPEAQRRLGGLVGDAAGFPNGRRPNDDVTDIVLRVAAGALLGPVPALGDGVNFNIGAPGTGLTANGIATRFPFLPTPHDGRNRRHIDCDETDANPCT